MTAMFTPNGKTELPFEIPLKPKGNKPLYETYHGVFVNIQVFLSMYFSCLLFTIEHVLMKISSWVKYFFFKVDENGMKIQRNVSVK